MYYVLEQNLLPWVNTFIMQYFPLLSERIKTVPLIN